MSFPLRQTLTSATVILSFLLISQAHAAGTVTVTQESPIGIFGDYLLTLPDTTQVTVHGQERKYLPVADAGTYSLAITPPADTQMTVTVSKDSLRFSTTSERSVNFTLMDDEDVLVAIQYRYEGTLVVESDPEGASFELIGPNDQRSTGTTPATYTGVAPGAYRVTFHKREGCQLVSPMQRYLEANETLTFTGKFTCGVTLPPPPPPPEPEEPVADPNAGRTLRIWVAAREAEVLPGGTARATITVKNTGTRTVHDLVISASVDPAVFQIAAPLPHFGIVSEDLAVWEVQELYAGKTWSVTLPLIVSKAVEQGDRTTITARASASDLAEKSGGSLLATTEIGVTGLPQTGFQFDVLFLGASMAAAALLAKKTVRRMAEQKA